jgi:hypothetical protein
MNAKFALSTVCAVAFAAFSASAAPATVNIPSTVHLPVFEPLISPCADPAADHFLEIDISQRPPPGAARVQKVSGWVTEDGTFNWPFVMRVRNIGDKPFAGKPGKQRVLVTEDDLLTGKKGRVVASVPFDRIDPRSGVAARFAFQASATDMNKQRFHRIYTISVKYDVMDAAIVTSQYGDCNLRNNEFFVEFDGSRKQWIYGK